MLSVRPTASPHYLRRPRLLERLPDAGGFVVWLEAPYGYGKSVLASQWAEVLEGEGWRVQWLSLAGREPRDALAQRLSLPPTAPWAVVHDELWSVPTLLVLEDLQGDEELSPLLQHAAGLVLLASRQPLPYPELPKLRTAGRLVHLTGTQLAFEEQEAVQLFADATRGHEAWRLTQGWSLPLHFAALTGDLPQQASLLEGVRRSVSERAWNELMFLATVDFLPKQAAVAATGDLARSGFLQSLADGYRLHPLIAESVLGAHRGEVEGALAESAHRLEPLRRGEAFERAGYLSGLGELLVSGEGGLYQQASEAFLRWHELAPPSPRPERRAYVTMARLLLNRFDDALADARELLTVEALAPGLRARLAGIAVYSLGAAKRFDQVAAFSTAAEAMLPQLEPHDAGGLLQNLGVLSFMRGDFAESERRFRESLAASARAEPSQARSLAEVRVRGNLYLMAWELRGDVDEPLAGQRELVARADLDDMAYVNLHQNLAVSHAMRGEEAEAAHELRKALARAGPHGALVLRSMLAYIEGDLPAFPPLLTAARKWEVFELCERVSALWLRTLRRAGDLTTAFELEPLLEMGPFTKLELVWACLERGDDERARRLLDETRGAYPYREYLLHWHAAAYLVERAEERLSELLALTVMGEQVLRYTGVPLSALPRHRPELARVYPLGEVLASGWTEAVRLRLVEVPPLAVRLLGEVGVARMGEQVPLTDRQRELVTLLALGLGREQVAEEIWPEADVKKQRNNLGVQLNLLRKQLEPWGVQTYLNEAGLVRFESDLHELERALQAGDAETVASLYREPLAPGVELGAVAEERDQLRERVIGALQEAATGADEESALRYLRLALELDPLNEEALQSLLALLVRLGRRREAQRHYQRFEALLRRELGLAPQAGTARLLEG